jgi:hypothetical protein
MQACPWHNSNHHRDPRSGPEAPERQAHLLHIHRLPVLMMFGWSQRTSPAYIAVIGTLLARYTLTGRMHASPNEVHFLIDLQGLMRARI